MNARIHRELVRLFGAGDVRRAAALDVAALDLSAELMERVHDAADALLALRGQPREQMAAVAALAPDVRVLLIAWLADTGLAARLLRAVVAA